MFPTDLSKKAQKFVRVADHADHKDGFTIYKICLCVRHRYLFFPNFHTWHLL